MTRAGCALLATGLAGTLAACDGGVATPGTGGLPDASAAPLVVLVSIDTLRDDHVGRVVGEGARAASLTPNLDRLAREGVRFTHAYATANETRLSHASVFTGRYPSELSALDAFTLPREVPTLPEALGAYGWQSAAFVAGGHLAGRYGIGRGFGTWKDDADWGSLQATVPDALAWLDTRDAARPTLLFVHGYDPHERALKPTPFGYAFADRDDGGRAAVAGRMHTGTAGIVDGVLTFEEGLLELTARTRPRFDATGLHADPELAPMALTAGDRAHLAGLYAGGVAWADAQFGRLMAGLDARGLLANATVVVFSDHGEGLGEQGVYHHRFHLSEETLHVPLLVRPPGGTPAGRTVEDVVDLTDLLPTVLGWAGATVPAGARGHDLGPAIDGSGRVGRAHAHAEGALRSVSVASATGRLTLGGLSVDNPALVGLARTLPLDAPAWTPTGDAARAEGGAETLRAALLTWREGLPRAAAAPTRAVVEGTRAGGYWSSSP